MISKLTKKIFEHNDFETGHFYVNKKFSWDCFIARRIQRRQIRGSKSKTEFFIVLDNDAANKDDLGYLISEGIQEIWDVARKHNFYDKKFDKNTTLLICYNGNITDPSLIPQIEEDPYIFKKNVLLYSKKQLDELIGLLDAESAFSSSNLNKILGNTEKFQEMKTGNLATGYSLLVRLFTKLPFLTYEAENEINLKTLDVDIKNQLERVELNDICDIVLRTDWGAVNSFDEVPETLMNIAGGSDG